MHTTLRLLVLALGWLSLSAIPLAEAPVAVEDELLRDATLVFRHAVSPPPAIPLSVMGQARAIAVVPRAQRDGVFYQGAGALSGRGLDGWTPPAIVALRAELPVALEDDEVDFVIVALTGRGVDLLTQPRSPGLLPDAMTAGPIGERASFVRADLVAYIRFGMVFAGVTLGDWETTEMRAGHERLYGRAYATDDILRGTGFFRLPKSARAWREALAAYSREMS